MSKTHEKIPSDFEVKVIGPDEVRRLVASGKGENVVTDGYCGLAWDDSIITNWTPAPSARCPFEPFHVYPDEDSEPQWSTHDMSGDRSNAADILDNVAVTLDTFGRADKAPLWGIVSENAGGIVAYAIGRENAERIVSALNKVSE